MATLTDLTLESARKGLDKKEFSAVELTQAYIGAMADAKVLNAYITQTPDRALDMAKAADAAMAAGRAGALTGIPIAVKDLFCTRGVRTTAASRMLENFVPPYESTVTAKLWDAGAVMLGKTNLDEFAMGSSNESSHFGPAENPWRGADGGARTPGGSSGGSAAAVSAHIALGATGTDTGGSIRQPAAYCGTVGVKPTYGRCSRWGIVAFASSLDQAGPFARTVQDTAILLRSMAGHDPKDSTCSDKEVPDYEKALGKSEKV
jgi:aspartyl-tRNA(Asn)/glutamyl-tRNA(Gln) amidotransferase subunit A